jgi:hypothetical protein
MPALVANYRKHVVETALQRFYSNINQAVKLSEIDHGEAKGWTWAEPAYDSEALQDWFDEYLQPYLKTIHVEKTESALNVYFPDGSVDSIRYRGKDHYYCIAANKLPEGISGKDCFTFGFYPDAPSWNEPWFLNNSNGADRVKYDNFANRGVEPYMSYSSWDGTIDTLLQRGNYSKAIQLNGWKIPDNYPVNF